MITDEVLGPYVHESDIPEQKNLSMKYKKYSLEHGSGETGKGHIYIYYNDDGFQYAVIFLGTSSPTTTIDALFDLNNLTKDSIPDDGVLNIRDIASTSNVTYGYSTSVGFSTGYVRVRVEAVKSVGTTDTFTIIAAPFN